MREDFGVSGRQTEGYLYYLATIRRYIHKYAMQQLFVYCFVVMET